MKSNLDTFNLLREFKRRWPVLAIMLLIAALSGGQALAGTLGTLTGTVTRSETGSPLAGVSVTVDGGYSTTTNGSGGYQLQLPAGLHAVNLSAYGYQPASASGVEIIADTATARNFSLSLDANTAIVQVSTVDASGHGWPLYGKIEIASTGYTAVAYTDPITGSADLALYTGTPYTLTVSSAGYTPSIRTVTPPATTTTENFPLTIDQSYCSAPGYPPTYFESLERNLGGFTTSRPTIWECGTPPSGFIPRSGSTVCSSNLARAGKHMEYDAYLYPPTIDLSANAGKSSILSWWQILDISSSNEVIYVDVSKDGGSSWTNVYEAGTWSWPPDEPNWTRHSVTLDPSYSVSNFRVRFNAWGMSSHTSYSYWDIDDVSVQSADGCPLAAGGLLVGNAYDAATSAGMNRVAISDGGPHTAFTGATPDDPRMGDGFYSLFLPSGEQSVYASIPGYGDARTVTIATDSISRQDFSMSACTYTVAPADFIIDAVGGAITIELSAGPGCAWRISGYPSWLTLNTPSSGYGSGTIRFMASTNSGTADRSGTLTVAGQTVTVSQGYGSGIYRGTVKSSTTGNPIAGATARLRPYPWAEWFYISATSDASGVFEFATLYQGAFEVAVSATGHEAATAAFAITPNTVTAQEIVLPVQTYLLNLSLSPTGGGLITGAGLNCSGGCSRRLDFGTTVQMETYPYAGYSFVGWSGCDTSAAETCTITMGADKTVSATFAACPTAPVKIDGAPPQYFTSLQNAFESPTGGIVACQGVIFTESPVLNVDKAITLGGGYNGDFSSVIARTVIYGALTIGRGSVAVDGLLIM